MSKEVLIIKQDLIFNLLERVNRIEGKIDKLLPEIKDMSKYLASARESLSCKQPKNHKREGKLPRKQPKKKTEPRMKEKTMPIQDGLGRVTFGVEK